MCCLNSAESNFLLLCFGALSPPQMNPLCRSRNSVVQPSAMFQEESIFWKEIRGILILVHSAHVIMHEFYVTRKSAHLFFVGTPPVLRTHVVHSAQVSITFQVSAYTSQLFVLSVQDAVLKYDNYSPLKCARSKLN